MMTFSEALEVVKKGGRVARNGWNGWNGQSMYVFVRSASHPHAAYLALFDARGLLVPWTVSQTDVLAEDWVLAETHAPQVSVTA